ncbi:MAG: hypothetical protein FOGNACKC_00129 [Anaerolineae bacterium]|nr:hypothetical protein [Anaerolineae bacterium]
MRRFFRYFWGDLIQQFYIIANLKRYLKENELSLITKAMIVGAVAAIIILLLKQVIHHMLAWTFELPAWAGSNVVIFLPLLLGALIVAALSNYTAQRIPYTDDLGHVHDLADIEGDGVERAIALYYSTRPSLANALRAEEGLENRWRYNSVSLLGRKMLASASTIGLGGSGGLEASAVLLGETLAAGLFKPRQWRLLPNWGAARRWKKWWQLEAPEALQTMQLCGVAAAISTLVGTPLMAAFFATEVMYRRTTIYQKFIYALAASVTAHAVSTGLGIYQQPFEIEQRILPPATFQFSLVVIGVSVAVSLVGLFYTGVTHAFNRAFGQVKNIWQRFVMGAIFTGLIAIAAAWAGGFDLWMVLGTGETALNQMLNQNVLVSVTLIALIGKMLTTSTTISSGGSAGLLVPSLLLGTMVANIFATAFQMPVVPLAAAAITASLVTLIKVPISSLVFVGEAFGAGYIGPAVVALIVSSLITYDNSIYRTQRDAARRRELVRGYSLQRIPVPGIFAGKTIRQLNIQSNYHVNVVGVVHPGDRREIAPEPDAVLSTRDELIIVGATEAVRAMGQLSKAQNDWLPEQAG